MQQSFKSLEIIYCLYVGFQAGEMVVVANLQVDPQQKTLWGGLQPLSHCNAYCHTSHPWLRDRWRSVSWQRGTGERDNQGPGPSHPGQWDEWRSIKLVWEGGTMCDNTGDGRRGRHDWHLNIHCFPSKLSTVEVSLWPGIVASSDTCAHHVVRSLLCPITRDQVEEARMVRGWRAGRGQVACLAPIRGIWPRCLRSGDIRQCGDQGRPGGDQGGPGGCQLSHRKQETLVSLC